MQMVALVTGASKGIGKKIAIDLADNGIKVIANILLDFRLFKNFDNFVCCTKICC